MSIRVASQVSELWAQLLVEDQAELGCSIHDDVGPTLAAMRLATEAAKRSGDAAAALPIINAGVDLLQHWVDARRERLRAGLVSRLGLADALSWYAAELEHGRGVVIRVDGECAAHDLPLDVAVATLGFAHEQLAHRLAGPASACRVSVSIHEQTLSFKLSIEVPRASALCHGRFSLIFKALGGTIEVSESEARYEAFLRLSFR